MPERKVTVLIVGGGGREAALAEAYDKSPEVGRILVAPGNDLIKFNCKKPVETFPDIKTTDTKAILDLRYSAGHIDLVDVAQDNAIEAGLVNHCRLLEIPAVGPIREAGRLEWDKIWAREFMTKNDIPAPKYQISYQRGNAYAYLDQADFQLPVVVKLPELAEGKGVWIARSKTEAMERLRSIFGTSVRRDRGLLLEEFVEGEEFSGFYLADGDSFLTLGFAQDHKTVNNNDEGDNTGGMGCISPTTLVDERLEKRVADEIVAPAIKGMRDLNIGYYGVLYVAGMYDRATTNLNVIEFNARWGDPEAEVIIPSIKNDFFELSMASAKSDLFTPIFSLLYKTSGIAYDGKIRISVAGVSLGYPGDYDNVKGRRVEGLKGVIYDQDVKVYGAGVKVEDGHFYASGGRLFHLVAEGDSVEEAREKVYAAMSRVYIRGDRPGENLLHFRTDIGLKEVQRQATS